MLKNLPKYCKSFSPRSKSNPTGLNVSPGAPNKPILLLSVIEMIITRQITRNQIPFNAEFIATFLRFWSHLEPVRKPDIGLPFYHLTSEPTGRRFAIAFGITK
jgi:putative restriction endonuclease